MRLGKLRQCWGWTRHNVLPVALVLLTVLSCLAAIQSVTFPGTIGGSWVVPNGWGEFALTSRGLCLSIMVDTSGDPLANLASAQGELKVVSKRRSLEDSILIPTFQKSNPRMNRVLTILRIPYAFTFLTGVGLIWLRRWLRTRNSRGRGFAVSEEGEAEKEAHDVVGRGKEGT